MSKADFIGKLFITKDVVFDGINMFYPETYFKLVDIRSDTINSLSEYPSSSSLCYAELEEVDIEELILGDYSVAKDGLDYDRACSIDKRSITVKVPVTQLFTLFKLYD